MNHAPGRVLDGTYLLGDVIGGGHGGTVYRATHIALQKAVAVKLLHGGDRLAARDFHQFRVEAEALGRLAHRHIVGVTDFGVDPHGNATPYLVMELVEGRTLDAVVTQAGPIDPARAARWMQQVAQALDHAHGHGVTHGDLTATNVILTGSGSDEVLKVIDFGLAQLGEPDGSDEAERETPLARRIVATPQYAAPERLRGAAATPASDIYACAVLAYRLMTGTHPFEGDARAVVLAHAAGEAPLASTRRAGLPPAIDAALAGALARDPSARPPGAGELAAQLAAAAREMAHARWRRTEAPRRLAVAVALALGGALLVPPLAALDVVQRIEGATEDVRVALSPAHAPDPRLLLVSIDDASLAADARPLTARADDFATTIERAFVAGAAVVAVDLLLPETWAASEAFGNLLLHRADRLVLGVASDGAAIVGPEAIDPLVAGALGPERASRLFALVTNVAAADGVIRRGRTAVVDEAGRARPTLAGRVGQIAGAVPDPEAPAWPFVVDYRRDPDRIARTGWQAFGAALTAGTRFDDRIVIVGAEFTGSGDRHRAPRPGRLATEVTGLTLQGLMVNTVLQHRRLQVAGSGWTRAIVAGLALITAAAVLWLPLRPARVAVPVTLATVMLLAVAAFRAGLVLDVASSLLLVTIAGGAALAIRSRLPERPE